MKNLKRYVYFQCLPKLEERFSASIPGCQKRATFENVFNQLSQDAIIQGWSPPESELPNNIERRNEAWLITAISKQNRNAGSKISTHDIPKQSCHNGAEQLKLSAWSAGVAFYLLRATLQNIRTSIDDIKTIKKENKGPNDAENLVPEVERLLDTLSQQMNRLYMLTHHSRLIWYMIKSSGVENAFTVYPRTVHIHAFIPNVTN
ncbi:hypothetical protein FRB95_001719 [Tulasnella sp. JGI-2019a]|nr:hypothetical protein FRB95_001719 [Tulasnella sp. JGI-2019a]